MLEIFLCLRLHGHTVENYESGAMQKFFLGGYVPNNVTDAQKFLRQLEDSGEEGVAAAAKEISQFHRTQVEDFLLNVLRFVRDERVLGLVYDNPGALQDMNHVLFMKLFNFIHERHLKSQIDPVFYESCAANLIRAYDIADRPVNLLAEMSPIYNVSRTSPEILHTFPGTQFDEAMAKHLAKVMTDDPRVLRNAQNTLLKMELPATLQALLENRINTGHMAQVAVYLPEFFCQNKLTDKYLEVFRGVLGDDHVIQLCAPYIAQKQSIHSVVKLSAIFGEDKFHTPNLFRSLRWDGNEGVLPQYLTGFLLLDFDETKLPMLAEYLMANLPKATRVSQSKAGVGYVAEIAKLAVRLDRGPEVLEALVDNLRELTDLGQSSPGAVINELVQLKCLPSLVSSTRRVISLLMDVVEIVGLKALHDLAPDVGSKVIGEFVDSRKSDLSEKQIIALFPQAKAHILGQALGL